MGMSEKRIIELWGDGVSLGDLVLSIVLTTIVTMGGFFLAPAHDTTKELFFGLIGAALGFIISSIIIKPKRNVTEKDHKEEEIHG
jgi:uncharacterized BrkB/YihY/UPF0761 family membrane protein